MMILHSISVMLVLLDYNEIFKLDIFTCINLFFQGMGKWELWTDEIKDAPPIPKVMRVVKQIDIRLR